MNRREAAALAHGNPDSFLHVIRSEIDLPDDVDPYDARVYAAAKASLDRMIRDGLLVHEAEPSVYLYEQVFQGRSQIGVVGCVHVNDYEQGVIRRHEKTRRDKEDDRTRHMLTLGAHPEPVFLAVRDGHGLDAMLRDAAAAQPLFDFEAEDVRHRVWRAPDPRPWVELLTAMPVSYVADGHHRCASAWRAGVKRREANPSHNSDEAYNWFPATLFPASQLRILPYHRVVRDLGGQTTADFLDRLREVGRVVPAHDPTPPRPGSFGIRLEGRWYLLALDPSRIPDDPVEGLDAALLEGLVLGPMLGITDIRTDPRVDFVGGIRGVPELERRTGSGEAAMAVAMHPVTVDQLLAVADAGGIMPPKTTWFEPKLRSGLFVHMID